ncbi:response regulator [Methylosinus sp. C49]|uniref:response regulator n=1 Tax=Methylosinus sp. C49 TaxID=2699395 RepID=UPI00136751B2|nr:response regulator [Methylosinus sp. C49]BBU62625.1 response regulator [Methylosinus sp. C49]
MGTEHWSAEAALGRRVLVVEDEPLIALALEETLAEHGFRVVASAQTVAVALRNIADAQFDVALLDLRIGAESVEPVADRLAAMGVPFVFTTGYGRSALPSAHATRLIVQKPFRTDALIAALVAASRRAAQDA